MTTTGRRFLRLLAAGLLAGTLVACGGRQPGDKIGEGAPPPAGRVVNVCNWPDYIAPGLIQQFAAETGVQVNYDTYDGNEMLETKLLTGQSGCDVVVPTANFLQRQVAAGVYQPIDRARLPNYGNLDPDMMAMLAENDPGNTHAVGYMWGTCAARGGRAGNRRPLCHSTGRDAQLVRRAGDPEGRAASVRGPDQ